MTATPHSPDDKTPQRAHDRQIVEVGAQALWTLAGSRTELRTQGDITAVAMAEAVIDAAQPLIEAQRDKELIERMMIPTKEMMIVAAYQHNHGVWLDGIFRAMLRQFAKENGIEIAN